MRMLHPRLILITPAKFEPNSFIEALEQALSSGDVASLLISEGSIGNFSTGNESVEIIERIASTTQKHGTSVLVQNNLAITEKTKVDGIQIDSGVENLESAIKKFQPKKIVGAGGVSTRHHAMKFAEKNVDYVFFGRLFSVETEFASQETNELAEWWAEIFEIPGVALAGAKLDSISELGKTGIDFVAARDAIWNYPAGANQAVGLATESLKKCRLRS